MFMDMAISIVAKHIDVESVVLVLVLESHVAEAILFVVLEGCPVGKSMVG